MAGRGGTARWRVGGLALAGQAVLAAVTLRDIAGRPDTAIRGPRRLWQVAVTANAGGAAAYWLLGRRRA